MTDRKATYVHQRQPLPVPSSMNDMKRFVQALEEILDDIYRRYGRLKVSDLDKTVNDTMATAQRTASAAQVTADAALVSAAQSDATAPETHGGTSGEVISQEQINAWATEAAALGRGLHLTGSELSAFISSYIKQKIAEA